ncbi:MAG: T9SS type A sorting domain-containing protein, partial [Bacteroidales bacterium]|nr:T9SS type A sorting domain-containing protein [Bacteroidales bacterium]
PNRFLLHFGEPSSIDENNQFSVRIYSNEDVVYVQQPAGMQGEIIIYDMVGREILRKETGDKTLSLIKVTNGIGYYLVKVQTEQFLVVEKVFIR